MKFWKNDYYLGLIYAFIALFSWGIHGPAGRYLALQGVDMYFVFSVRIWIGCLIFFIYLKAKGKLKVNFKENWNLVWGLAVVGVVINSMLYHLALIYLPGTLVMILENLAPVFVLLMSFLLYKKYPSMFEITALSLSFIGIFFIISGKGNFPKLGDNYYLGVILGVLTGLTFGFYIFFSSVLMKPLKSDPIKIIQFLFRIFLISSILVIPIILFSGQKPSGFKQWFWLIEMGVFQSGLSYIFWNLALARISANKASILFLFTIFFTTINEIIFLDLHLNLPLVLGGLFIISGGYLVKRDAKRGEKIKR